MLKYTEYKNNVEETEKLKNLDEVKQSAIGWLEVYQDIDNESYQEEMITIKNTNSIKTINEIMEEFGYSYK